MRPCVELTDNDDFEDGTTLHVNLLNKHYFKEESDEEEENSWSKWPVVDAVVVAVAVVVVVVYIMVQI